jgi:hypothetical protein
MDWNIVTRRKFLASTAGCLAASAGVAPLAAQSPPARKDRLRDRLWLFGSPTGSTAPHTRRRSVTSPAEGAFYLGIPNLYMNQANAGAEALRKNRIAGMMFLSNGVMDLGFEAVDWTRRWIEKVGDTRL